MGIRLRNMMFLLSMVALFVLGANSDYASAELADGTYTIDYTVMHATDPSASIANDYWEKPATLHVKNGEITAEMKLNHSSWIVAFQTPTNGGFADVAVVSEDEGDDTRVVQFPLEGIDDMTEAKIHVIVPDIDYDHHYTIRFDFNENSLTALETAASSEEDKNEEDKKDDEPLGTAQSSEDEGKRTHTDTSKPTEEDNPQTNDAAPIALLSSLAIVSAIVLLRKRLRQVS